MSLTIAQRQSIRLFSADFIKKYNVGMIGYRRFLVNGITTGFCIDPMLDGEIANIINNSASTYVDEVSSCFLSGTFIKIRRNYVNKADPFSQEMVRYNVSKTFVYYVRTNDSMVEGFYCTTDDSDNNFELLTADKLGMNNFFMHLQHQVDSGRLVEHTPKASIHCLTTPKSIIPMEAPVPENVSLSMDGIIVTISFREAQILIPLALGKSYKEIAQRYSLSPRTVETYVQRALHKFKNINKNNLASYLVRSEMNMPVIKELFF